VTLTGQGRDPDIFECKYLENRFVCCLETAFMLRSRSYAVTKVSVVAFDNKMSLILSTDVESSHSSELHTWHFGPKTATLPMVATEALCTEFEHRGVTDRQTDNDIHREIETHTERGPIP